ncbi:ABC transporter ATP-binding protein [Rhizobium sp. SGZ-381]|uniref:ABC transporter ATP-binding protein n=1 Tax=Rhizobium sp. SGZ-381 TaxID=3342800 RepID=UPI00366B1501
MADARTAVAVKVKGLTRRFGDRTVIANLDLEIRRGEFVALLGASGCGKSTLLRILADLDHDLEGDVLVSPHRGVAFQSPRLFPWKRVWRNVVAGTENRRDRARAQSVLDEVGLSHRANAWPKDLSGGEAQRASLARALARNPDLLLLDEPFGALDALTRLKAQALVADLWQRHRQAVLLVTHDVDEALLLADRILVMDAGQIAHTMDVRRPRPRTAGDPAFDQQRLQLLKWLGIGASDTAQ